MKRPKKPRRWWLLLDPDGMATNVEESRSKLEWAEAPDYPIVEVVEVLPRTNGLPKSTKRKAR